MLVTGLSAPGKCWRTSSSWLQAIFGICVGYKSSWCQVPNLLIGEEWLHLDAEHQTTNSPTIIAKGAVRNRCDLDICFHFNKLSLSKGGGKMFHELLSSSVGPDETMGSQGLPTKLETCPPSEKEALGGCCSGLDRSIRFTCCDLEAQEETLHCHCISQGFTGVQCLPRGCYSGKKKKKRWVLQWKAPEVLQVNIAWVSPDPFSGKVGTVMWWINQKMYLTQKTTMSFKYPFTPTYFLWVKISP